MKKFVKLCLSFLIFGVLVEQISAQSTRKLEKEILDRLFSDKNYDPRIRPDGTNYTDGPVSVTIQMVVRNIESLDDIKMDHTSQITFRQSWTDSRLKYDDHNGRIRYLTLTDPGRMWKPDTFFRNEKTGHFHELLAPNVLARIYPDGKVLYSIRVTSTYACPMNHKLFPHDQQTCAISLSSYGYTTDDVVYQWKAQDPFTIGKDVSLSKFDIKGTQTGYCTSKTSTGEYGCAQVEIKFARKFSRYLVQIYIPCMMMILVSWTTFWIDPKHVTARFVVLVATLFTMASLVSFLNATLPQVSYTMAVDVWTGVSLTFVFAALLETCTVIFLIDNPDADSCPLRKVFPPIGRFNLDIISRFSFIIGYAFFVLLYSTVNAIRI